MRPSISGAAFFVTVFSCGGAALAQPAPQPLPPLPPPSAEPALQPPPSQPPPPALPPPPAPSTSAPEDEAPPPAAYTYTPPPRPAGSCIGVVVTDAPLDGAACARLARRVGLGLARTGSTAHHGSGEIFLACATGIRADRAGRMTGPAALGASDLNPFFEAVVDASEEAVLNSMLTSPTVTGRAGTTRQGLPVDELRRLLRL